MDQEDAAGRGLERAASALARRIGAETRITVLTGAGVSAASGVPTFRGADGLWKGRYRSDHLATPEAFGRDPALVWEWYDWRRQRIAACDPNRAHHVLAAWARRYPRCTVITQNVDGLHERAGLADVLSLHGSIWQVRCWNRCAARPDAWTDATVPFPSIPPRCPDCGGLLRPAVVWFGEPLDAEVLSRAQAAAACDVFITAGTSARVFPAAGLIPEARRLGGFVVEIDPNATEASDSVDLRLVASADVAFDAIERALLSRG